MAVVNIRNKWRDAGSSVQERNPERENFAVTIDGVTINTSAFCEAFHAARFENRNARRSEFGIALRDNLDADKFVSLFQDFIAQYVDADQKLTMEKKDSRFNYLEDLYEDVRVLDSGSPAELFSRIRENSNIDAACFKNMGYRIFLYCEPHSVTCKCQNGGPGSFDIFLKASSERPVFPMGVVSIRDSGNACLTNRSATGR